MRELKFRAWNKGNKCMLIPDELDNYFISQSKVFLWDADFLGWVEDVNSEFEYMQFTGLKDKNNKDIYEGDIVYWPHVDERTDAKVIIWGDEDNGWKADKPDGTLDSWLDNLCIILGNKYENPELLSK